MAPRNTSSAVIIRPTSGGETFRRRLRVACAELDMTYQEFVEAALDQHEAAKAKMAHPLDRRAVST
ncbi:ribbon-helix-helix DNA binding domain protein [Gordonia phage AnClar]|nr:ribbon-helix-helix DNA binding domain protein [Gordonia phage AnClar]